MLFFYIAGAKSGMCQSELYILDNVVFPSLVVSVHLHHERAMLPASILPLCWYYFYTTSG